VKLNTYLKLTMFPIFTGATFNLAAFALHYFSSASVAALRFGLASVLLVCILFMTGKRRQGIIKRNAKVFLALGVIGVFGFNIFFFLGMKWTSPLNGALIMATNPLVTTLFSTWLLQTKISSRQAVGIAISFAGVFLVLTHGSIQVITTLSFSVGDVLILAGNVCWALYSVLSRKWVKAATPMETTTYTMVPGAIALCLLVPFSPGTTPLTTVPVAGWGAILFMAVCTSVLGYLWWNQAIAEIGASKTSVFFNLVPIVTMIISILSGQTINPMQITGTTLVLLGVLAASDVMRSNKVMLGVK
jgi:drug/metabolite transporter (DMT)-like permease